MWLSIYIIEKLILANIDTNHSIALTCMNCVVCIYVKFKRYKPYLNWLLKTTLIFNANSFSIIISSQNFYKSVSCEFDYVKCIL